MRWGAIQRPSEKYAVGIVEGRREAPQAMDVFVVPRACDNQNRLQLLESVQRGNQDIQPRDVVNPAEKKRDQPIANLRKGVAEKTSSR